MNEGLGRNNICPCGSGKKFKKCCLSAGRIIVSDNEWQRIRETEGRLMTEILLPWVRSTAPSLPLYAWDEFWFGEKSWPQDLYEGVAGQLFDAWFLFNWKPIIPRTMTQTEIEEGFPIALQYLQKKGYRISDFEKRFIREICCTHFSFYVVKDVILGKSLTLKDIFLKSEVIVKELQGSSVLKAGDIVFTRVLSMDGQAVCVGMMPILIPSHYHTELLDIREVLIEEQGELNSEKLSGELETVTREILFEFLEEILNPVAPQMYNTEGDPIVFCRVSFSLECSPEEACKALYPISLEKSPDEFLAHAKRLKKTGEITKIELPWIQRGNKRHKYLENTLLGNIVIQPKKIAVEVNSENRAKEVKQVIIRTLGNKVNFLHLKKQTAKQTMGRIGDHESVQSASATRMEDIPSEILEKMKKHFQQHWVNWLDQPIPALNNITPLEASTTEAGRERLEALLLDFECRNNRMNDQQQLQADVAWLRKQLNL